MGHIDCRWHQRAFSEVMSAHSGLKQCFSTVNHSAISLCTMVDANPLPDGIVGASVLAALFFIEPCCTHSGIVRTLQKRILSANAMQMTRPIAMFHVFSFASFMRADCIHHD
jgi:hypothetical protein